ncbi:EAL domain-containing protein [Pseudoxanthomonas sp. USHLN014]|uniref:EAL domain-containing protein n=1 Tax=Pseudoxanthomonas sp. USHLN014 TaxID=3081297 RepID=UPI00301D9E4B
MGRARIIVAATGLALLGIAVPIIATLAMSWHLAVRNEQQRLDQFAALALERAQSTMDEATQVLHTMQRSRLVPCSDAHIAQMRRAAMDSAAVKEVGFFQGGLLRCTSWGPTKVRVPDDLPADAVGPDGLRLYARVLPQISGGRQMLVLHQHNYNVLIDPARFSDLVLEPDIGLLVRNAQGVVLSERNLSDEALSRAMRQRRDNGSDAAHLFSVKRRDGWMVVVSAPMARAAAGLPRQQGMLLPIGLLIAAVAVAMVILGFKRRLSPTGALTRAVQRQEFVAHYQPIVRLADAAIVGAEALVRWRRPDGTLVRPDQFIPLAEQTGLIDAITDQVLAAIVCDLGPLLAAHPCLHVSLNLSAADMRSGRLLAVLAQALEGSGIAPRQLWLEATERGFVDIAAARRTIEQARLAGHRVAIDDFGTGYSSLQYLQGLPLDALKIDKTFIDAIGTGAATSAVTGHIIDMARELGLDCVAEGIETTAQADFLRAQGVGYGQGWLFGKAVPAVTFIELYLTQQAARAAAAARENEAGH